MAALAIVAAACKQQARVPRRGDEGAWMGLDCFVWLARDSLGLPDMLQVRGREARVWIFESFEPTLALQVRASDDRPVVRAWSLEEVHDAPGRARRCEEFGVMPDHAVRPVAVPDGRWSDLMTRIEALAREQDACDGNSQDGTTIVVEAIDGDAHWMATASSGCEETAARDLLDLRLEVYRLLGLEPRFP